MFVSNASPAVDLHGFPPGYFLIRSTATGRLLDVAQGKSMDGTPLVLWPSTETSLVETLRRREADNQVFFIDNTTGALSSKVNGHAIDIEDDSLVIRHRQPMLRPYPSLRSHPLPTFTYVPKTGQILVSLACDPAHHAHDAQTALGQLPNDGWTHVLTAIPQQRAPGLVENLSTWFTSAAALAGGRSAPAAPAEVFDGHIELADGDVLDHERSDAGEVDDDPEPLREARVVLAGPDPPEGPAALRRRWDIVPLRPHKAMTGAI